MMGLALFYLYLFFGFQMVMLLIVWALIVIWRR